MLALLKNSYVTKAILSIMLTTENPFLNSLFQTTIFVNFNMTKSFKLPKRIKSSDSEFEASPSQKLELYFDAVSVVLACNTVLI